jgi:signal transduction histidine kinase
MRLLNFLLIATTISFLVGLNGYGKPNLDPRVDQLIKLKVDSAFARDSIQRLNYVKAHLNKAYHFLNNNQLDSAISNADLVTKFDVNLIPGEILAQAYYIIGKAYRINRKSDIALKNYLVAIQKLRYSDEIGYKSEICQELAIIYHENGWISKSIEKYIDAYKVETSLGNENKQIELLHAIVSLYIKSNDYKNAVVYQEKLLPLYSKHNIHDVLDLMNELSANHVILNNHQIAINLQSQIFNSRKKMNDLEGQFETLLEIVKIYKDQSDYEKLYAYIRSFNGLYKNQKKKDLTPQIKLLKGEILMIYGDLLVLWGNLEVKDNFERALLYYDSAHFLFTSVTNGNKVAETKISQANVYFKLKDYKSAIDNCELAIPLYKKEKNFAKLIQAYQLISESYMKLDRYKLAYQAQAQFLLYSDSLEKIQLKHMDELIGQYKENANRIAFPLLHLEIEKQKRDIELLVKEKSLNDLALKNEQLKNKQVTNENILLQQRIEADLREKEILNLLAEKSRQEAELKSQQINKITNEQQIYALEQEKKLGELKLQKANAQRTVFLLSIIISLIVLISVIIGYFNIRKSRSNIAARNKFIEEHNSKLKKLNQEKNRLIRIVAHDLKNPLTSALTMSDMLYKRDKFIPDDDQNISLIRRSLRRMQEMINKILDVKAIDAEKLNLEIEAINVKQVIAFVIESFSRKAKNKQIIISNDAEELYINVDLDYFTQILENLISNALKFSSLNTVIKVNTTDLEGACRISITDQGPGFSIKEKKQIFKEYKTLSPKPTNGESSNGLGLSIVKKYVDAMGGKVWCDTTPGKGSTFHIEFEKALEIA